MSGEKFNALRVIQSAQEIENLTRALKWLREYGVTLSHRDSNTFSLTFRANTASSCHGAPEAEKQISGVARTMIKEIIARAIEDSENTIGMCRNAIKEESKSQS